MLGQGVSPAQIIAYHKKRYGSVLLKNSLVLETHLSYSMMYITCAKNVQQNCGKNIHETP